MKALVLGALAMDHYVLCGEFPADDMMVFAEKSFFSAGGSGANIAVNLAVLGHRVDFYCGAGDDQEADKLLEYLRGNQVNVIADIQKGPSAQTLIMVDKQGQRRMISFGGNALFNSSAGVLEGIQAVCIADSFPEIAEKIAGIYSGKKKIYVPGGCGLYFGIDIIKKLAAKMEVTILSEPEAEAIGEGFAGISPVVIVTCGAQATRWYRNSEEHLVPVSRIEAQVVDSTGAGDAFAGGFIDAYAASRGIEESIVAGHNLAAKIITKYGANLGREE